MNSPLKIDLKTEIFPLLIILAAILTSVLAYPHLPAQVISHWDFAGQANGWSSRNFHTFFFPGLLIGMYILFYFLPFLDPKKERYADFAKVYLFFRTAIILVMFAVYLVATLVNLGYPVSVNGTIPVIIGLLMIFMGNYMGKLKKNWFVGIRTPWTMSSENVWNKTHRLGGWLFMLFGIVLLITPFLSKQIFSFLFTATLAFVVIVPFAYSYYLYQKEKK